MMSFVCKKNKIKASLLGGKATNSIGSIRAASGLCGELCVVWGPPLLGYPESATYG